MAELTLKIINTGETIPVSDLELGQVTNEKLLSELIAAGYLYYEDGCPEYRIMNPQNSPVLGNSSLSHIGFCDGDTIRIVAKPNGAVL